MFPEGSGVEGLAPYEMLGGRLGGSDWIMDVLTKSEE